MKHRGYIYGLAHKGEIRYVGKSTRSLRQRLTRHLREARLSIPGKRHVFDWMRSVDFDVQIVELERDPHDLGEAERAWVATCRLYGCDLTNISEGGNGPVVYGRTPWNKGRKGVSPETSARMSAAARARKDRPRHTEESRRKLSNALKGKEALRENGRRMMALMNGRQHTPEARRKAGDTNRRLWQNYTPEERQRRCDAIREGKARARAARGGDAICVQTQE